jgi:hypothetical protein
MNYFWIHVMLILTYSAGTNIDGGNSGTDTWIEFGFTEESLRHIF